MLVGQALRKKNVQECQSARRLLILFVDSERVLDWHVVEAVRPAIVFFNGGDRQRRQRGDQLAIGTTATESIERTWPAAVTMTAVAFELDDDLLGSALHSRVFGRLACANSFFRKRYCRCPPLTDRAVRRLSAEKHRVDDTR